MSRLYFNHSTADIVKESDNCWDVDTLIALTEELTKRRQSPAIEAQIATNQRRIKDLSWDPVTRGPVFNAENSPQARAAKPRIEELRTQLLDLSKQNRLIKFVHSAAGKRFVRLIDEDPFELFDQLQAGAEIELCPLPRPPDEPEDEQTEAFQDELEAFLLIDRTYLKEQRAVEGDDDEEAKLRTAERAARDRLRKKLKMPARKEIKKSADQHARDLGYKTEFDLRSRGTRAPYRSDDQWQTLLDEDELERRLKHISAEVRESREEYGVDTLFFVFGFLEWSPPTPEGESNEVFFSPLVLVPSSIEKVRVGQVRVDETLRLGNNGNEARRLPEDIYKITALEGDDPTGNLTLKQRMLRDHSIVLPDLPASDPISLELYFRQIETAIEHRPEWKLRRFVTLTHLAFSRLPMWKDLDATAGEKSAPHLHPIVGEIFGGRPQDDREQSVETETAMQPRPAIPLVLDCDSSQYDAIRRVLAGNNLVIQGPPGTGKSQTIANMIAAALDQGKSVLFVAEKQVALEVVEKRLSEAGLGEYLLKLHSAKAGRSEFLQAIRERLDVDELSTDDEADREARDHHTSAASALDEYASVINSAFGAAKLTLHDIFWREIAVSERPFPAELNTYYLPEVECWTKEDLRTRRAAFAAWSQYRGELKGIGGRNQWHWVTGTDVHVIEQRSIVTATRAVMQTLHPITAAIDAGPFAVTASNLKRALALAGKLEGLSERFVSNRPALWSYAQRKDTQDRVGAVEKAVAGIETSTAAIRSFSHRSLEDVPAAANALTAIANDCDVLPGTAEKEDLTSLKLRSAQNRSLLGITADAAEILAKVASITRIPSIETTPYGPRLAALYLELLAATPEFATAQNVDVAREGFSSEVLQLIDATKRFRLSYQKSQNALKSPISSVTIDELREAVQEIEKAWFGSWLINPRYRKAIRLKTRLLTKGDREETLAVFIQIIQLKNENSELSQLGSRVWNSTFNPLTFDLPKAEEVVKWVSEVRQSTPILEQHSVELRQSVFRTIEDEVSAAKILRQQGWIEKLRAVGDVCQIHRKAPREVAEVLESEFVVQKNLIAFCERWEWQGSLAKINRNAASDYLRSIIQARGVLEAHRDIHSLFYPNHHEAISDLSKIREEIAQIHSLQLTKEWSSAVLADDGDEAWNNLIDRGRQLQTALKRFSDHLGILSNLAKIRPEQLDAWHSQKPAALVATLEQSLAAEPQLTLQCATQANSALLEKLGLLALTSLLDKQTDEIGDAGDLFDRIFYRSLAQKALLTVPGLKEFRHASPGALRERFSRYDRSLKKLDQLKLIEKLSGKAVPPGVSTGPIKERTELALLKHVAGLERPRTTLRQLMHRSGRALQALKPCFMMSPLSVAQLIDRKALTFDLVIFDEASQVRPEDAISAILRSRQFVVVGDQMQLPPTNFGVMAVEPASDDIDGEPEENSAAVESILELAAAAYGNGPMLLWHYRSRDPSLIAFSNREFYNRRLHVFPSPTKRSDHTGVKYVHIDGIYGARTNPIEAKKCVEAAMEFMRRQPHRSLGIVALNRPQADLIELELEQQIAKDPAAREYVRSWKERERPEELFVKNLESVQGDERDAIFISTVFGKNSDGVYHNRYGPINTAVGHRRLNVLFTRAKFQTIVFSSIPIEQMTSGDGAHWGLRAFKGYLEYARTGRLETGTVTGRPPDSPFEEAVISALQSRGFQCEPQVGVDGFFIDLAVRCQSDPDKFILGIECDGASYHSSRSARDRDRLREDVLRGYGWDLHRIWSTDWFRDRPTEMARLLLSVEIAQKQSRERATV